MLQIFMFRVSRPLVKCIRSNLLTMKGCVWPCLQKLRSELKVPYVAYENYHFYYIYFRQRKLDSFSLCCYATLYVKDVQCDYPKTEGGALSSCNRMIEALGPRQSIWLLGILAVLRNLVVIAWRLIRRDDHPVQTCLLTNLAVSDFLMGVYLMIIAIKDLQWAGNISLTKYL